MENNTGKYEVSGQIDLATDGIVTIAYGESLEMEGLDKRYVTTVADER